MVGPAGYLRVDFYGADELLPLDDPDLVTWSMATSALRQHAASGSSGSSWSLPIPAGVSLARGSLRVALTYRRSDAAAAGRDIFTVPTLREMCEVENLLLGTDGYDSVCWRGVPPVLSTRSAATGRYCAIQPYSAVALFYVDWPTAAEARAVLAVARSLCTSLLAVASDRRLAAPLVSALLAALSPHDTAPVVSAAVTALVLNASIGGAPPLRQNRLLDASAVASLAAWLGELASDFLVAGGVLRSVPSLFFQPGWRTLVGVSIEVGLLATFLAKPLDAARESIGAALNEMDFIVAILSPPGGAAPPAAASVFLNGTHTRRCDPLDGAYVAARRAQLVALVQRSAEARVRFGSLLTLRALASNVSDAARSVLGFGAPVVGWSSPSVDVPGQTAAWTRVYDQVLQRPCNGHVTARVTACGWRPTCSPLPRSWNGHGTAM